MPILFTSSKKGIGITELLDAIATFALAPDQLQRVLVKKEGDTVKEIPLVVKEDGWALYGFGTVYSFTHDPRFLQTAEHCAQYYVEHTPEQGVPPNDWMEPNPTRPYESSAAARFSST